jgi:TonB family protein
MRAVSSAVSLGVHVALGAAVVFGTAKTGQSTPAQGRQVAVIFQHLPAPSIAADGFPSQLATLETPDLSFIGVPSDVLQSGAPSGPLFPIRAPSSAAPGVGSAGPWIASIGEEAPEVLTGPLPLYPELLRTAGIEGRVILEGWVDTTGRVAAASVVVVSATNPGFVAPARRALLETLFRPARVGGRAVRMLVRVPFEFTIRGTGHAR